MWRALVVVGLTAHVAWACPSGKQLAVARGKPKVDGVLDDAVWKTACFISDFEQKTPNYGAKPTHPIKVAVAIDGEMLYVAARMWSAGPDDIDDALTARDVTDQAERFIVSIDPSHTRRIAYSFAVTAAGVRADWIHTDDTEGSRDMSWDPVWVARTAILADGWSAEMAIPLTQVRLPSTPAKSWGINFDWYLPRRNEDVFWRAVPKDRTAWASYFGELVDLPPVRPHINVEVMPYVAARGTVDEVAATPPMKRALAGFEAGLDAKLRPLPGLVINATVNPDFGQVEADPAFVNLTAYEVTLPEKRPFFVENNNLFHNFEAEYFYSRRIGGVPTRLPDYDAIDLPQEVRILGAAAAGGYVEANTQIAAIAAVTDETSAAAIVNGRRTDLTVSPLTLWGATHVEHQVGPASVVSFTGTLVERALGGTGLDQLLNHSAGYALVDSVLRTDDGDWELFPYVGVSAVAGTAASIATIEETSTHYFQRPDQTYLHVDTDAHRLSGWNAGTWLTKRSGKVNGNLGCGLMSPGFELNDLGVLHQADNIECNAELQRTVTEPTDRLYAWGTGIYVDDNWTFGGDRRPATLQAHVNATLPNQWSGAASIAGYTPGDNPDLTRGGPLMKVGWAERFGWNISSPYGRANQLALGGGIDHSEQLDNGFDVEVTAATRVMPALRLDLIPSLTIIENHRQYLDTVVDPEATETYGARYVFGHLHRREAAVQVRATLALSPDLVITVYAQPFVSVGHYDQIGELARAGTDQVRWYDIAVHDPGLRTIVDRGSAFSIGEPDFTVASLRSTAVLRWEFRPGSTLYIAWQQDRGGVTSTLSQPLHSALKGPFDQSAIHTLAIKLSYWFG
ncbi:MAG TPA: DUF5916 domain-containing protein [Kofleriaceae bacterium]|nr:DUF5916 domain-containing protein [Kofleriaceae bacterium]